MVNIVEAATTISPLRRLRSLIIAIVIIGCMLIFLFLDGMKNVQGLLTPLAILRLYHLLVYLDEGVRFKWR